MANEKRLIDLDVAIAKIKDEGVLGEGYAAYERIEDVCDMLEDCPAVDAVEVVHGAWLDGKLNYITLSRGNYICSNCRSATGVVKFNYCPNCGAKMDGDVNGNL